MAKITWELLAAIDWAKTPIGPIETWPHALRSVVQLILELPTPAVVFWGPEQTQIYNDGYAFIMGPRHPQYLGATYRECWPDTYPVLMPSMLRVLERGETVEVTSAEPIFITRHGFVEETYFSFTFSPVRDDAGNIAGIYQPVVEMTSLVLQQRRAETLRRLTTRNEALAHALATFDECPMDVPLASIYLSEDHALRLAGSTGWGNTPAEAALAPLGSELTRAFTTNTTLEVPIDRVTRPWPEPVTRALVVPIRRAPSDEPLGVLVLGASPRLHLDAPYRAFSEAVARELATNLVAQRAERIERDWFERERSARREADALREAHARRTALLFEHAPVGIAVLRGPQHVYEVANPQYMTLIGGRPLLHRAVRDALPELVDHGIFEILDRVYQTGEPYIGRSVRFHLARGDGGFDEKFFDFVYEAIPGDDGAIDSIMVIAFDVSELSIARHDAEAASIAKDDFFAMLGHELRNPLAPITTALQLMRMRGDKTSERERTVIEHQVEQITRLVDDLLDVSRIARGKVTLKRAPIELAQVVTSAIEMAAPLLEERRHHLAVEVPAQGFVINGDASRLAQVVSNLLTNAAKYTEPGGQVWIIAQRTGEPPNERIVLRVTDSGIGIAPDMLSRVFEPFTQEEQALDRAQGGLGLGLTIAKNLVTLHGGSVRVESAGVGKGSTFVIDLPASAMIPGAPPPSQVPLEPPRSVRPKMRVLVVDDNEDAAELLAEALTLLGYETRVAHDGAEALRAVELEEPDVALLDIGLPVMNGYELAGRLRSGPLGDRLRLVAVTGYGQDADRARTRNAGFDAHLVKPVQIEQVRALLRGYQARPT